MDARDTALFLDSLPCNSRPFIARLDEILIQCGLDIHVPHGFTPEQFVAAMMRDKKVNSGTLRMVLMLGIGASEVQSIENPLELFVPVLNDASLVTPGS